MNKVKYISMWILGTIILIALLCARAWPDWLLNSFGVACYLALFPAMYFLFKAICKEVNKRNEDKE